MIVPAYGASQNGFSGLAGISDSIPLHLAKLSAGVRSCRISHHAAVVLGIGLLPVPPQEKPPVVGHFRPDDGEQFRIGCMAGPSSYGRARMK